MDDVKYFLRPLRPEDAGRMTEMMHDAGTVRYLQVGGPAYTEETALRFIQNAADESRHLHRAVVDDRDVFHGSVSLKNIDLENEEAEYAISIHPDAQGKGAAQAASSGILEIAFRDLKLQRVYLNVLADNERANRFYQKFGFQYTRSSVMVFRDQEKVLNWYERKNL